MNVVNVRIKQLETRVATAGLFFGDSPEGKFRRKLEPGEVIALDADDQLTIDALAGGKLEITLDPATRPLDFDTEPEARFSSPSFRPRDIDEEAEAETVRAAIAERMAALQAPQATQETVQPQPGVGAAQPLATPDAAAAGGATGGDNPRTARRRQAASG